MLVLTLEHIQQKLGMDLPVGMTQLCFDGTFMGASVGLEACFFGSLNLNSGSKFQHPSVKMLALLPTYDKDAAVKTLTQQRIKKREMGVHQACIGVIVHDPQQVFQQRQGSAGSVSGWKDVLDASNHAVLGSGPQGYRTALP